jgi:phosphoribosyl-AMP cyclohydrolase
MAPGIGIGLGVPFQKNAFSFQAYWTTLTSGLIVYRKGERGGMYVIDKSEDGGTTWELDLVRLDPDEDSIIISIDDGVEGYRHVIRDEAYCIDHELDATGFDGTEGVNWENVYNTNTI